MLSGTKSKYIFTFLSSRTPGYCTDRSFQLGMSIELWHIQAHFLEFVARSGTSESPVQVRLTPRLFRYNFWIANIFRSLKFFRVVNLLRAVPLIGMPILYIITLFPSLQEAKSKHDQYTRDKSTRRLDKETGRRDFIRFAHLHAIPKPL